MIRLKSSAARAVPLLCIVLAMISTTSLAAADDISIITLEVDHDEADTWSSVLATIRAAPFKGENNTTHYVDRNVIVTLTDLDKLEVLCVDENISLISGTIATYAFRILPDWGEFLLEVRVFDPYTETEQYKYVKVVYSTDYERYLQALAIDARLKGHEEDSAALFDKMLGLTFTMMLLVGILIPVAMLRLEHKSARREARSSFWDKAQDKFFNFSFVVPALHHYFEDPNYEFRALGKRAYRERKVRGALMALNVDQLQMQRVEDALNEQLREFEELKTSERPMTAASLAAAVAKQIDREMDVDILVADHEERLAAEEEDV